MQARARAARPPPSQRTSGLLLVSVQPGSRKQFLSPEQASQPPGLQQNPLYTGGCVWTSGQRQNCQRAVRLGNPSHQTPSPGRSGSPQTTADHPESRTFCKPGVQGCLRVGLPLTPCTREAPPQPRACPHPALPDALGLNSARVRGTPFLSPAGHTVRPFVPKGGPLGGRAHCPLASPPPASKEITQALIRSPRDRRKLECPRCLIAPAPAAAAGTLEARVMAHIQLPSQPRHDLGRLGARCCFNEKSGVGEWLRLRGGRKGEGSMRLPSVHLSTPAAGPSTAGHRPRWALMGAGDPCRDKESPTLWNAGTNLSWAEAGEG